MTASATIKRVREDLYLIMLPIPIPGFDNFVATWVHTADPVTVIDVGPSISAPALLAALTELGVRRPERILLTHIHIDHAGGAGVVAAAFPHTPVVCHPNAVSHLIDPERLWQGSLKTLGDTARAYGPIRPVPTDQILTPDQINASSLVCVDTPGHAAHHLSFLIGDLLFAGEAGGVCLPFKDRTLYLRPATPPRFILEIYLESIDRLVALRPRSICYGHIGMRANAIQLLQAHRDQLLLWQDLIQPFCGTAGTDPLAAMRACRASLLNNDPLLSGFSRLKNTVAARERVFLLNSIKGYWDYLLGG